MSYQCHYYTSGAVRRSYCDLAFPRKNPFEEDKRTMVSCAERLLTSHCLSLERWYMLDVTKRD